MDYKFTIIAGVTLVILKYNSYKYFVTNEWVLDENEP